MRGREFLMKDAYSFDVDEAGARHSYNIMVLTYIRTFARLGIRAIPMQADTGPIGGNLSHEFIVLAETGESEVFHDSIMISDVDDKAFEFALNTPYLAQEAFDSVCSRYAATSEKRDLEREAQLKGTLQQSRGIEVGQVFYFGTKYSAAMGLSVQGADGTAIVPHMGSYGIGVSRLMGAIVEASHDKDGIIWPDAVAPYKVALINLRVDDAACLAAADALYDRLSAAGVEVLYDDRDERGGAKFATADLIGVPWQVVIGPKGVAAGTVEVKRRGAGTREDMSVDAALKVLTA